MASPTTVLSNALLSIKPSGDPLLIRAGQIHQELLATSAHVRLPNFTSIHTQDLAFLFAAYDDRFLGGLCRQALEGRRLDFRLSPRMTRAGGKTTRYQTRDNKVRYEIAIASSILFDSFRPTDRTITVCGLACQDRLDALQRIFEHEMVHLAEMLCWGESDCTAARFRNIASGLFHHKSHTHQLITRRERAAESGIRVGSRVVFTFEGEQLIGRVNRITKRATVLVDHPQGARYSNGSRYKTYYVPIPSLTPV